jgi:hypothetical protein
VDIELLPGSEIVQQGLNDLVLNKKTIPALLVSIGHPKLRSLGFEIANPIPDPEKKLYQLLSSMHGNAAHSRYNALIRRLVSFERALARARSKSAS